MFQSAVHSRLQEFAETKDKLYAIGHVTIETEICKIVPPEGYKVALLVVIGSAEADGDSFTFQTLQSGEWEDIIPIVYVIANGHFNFAFPRWVPEQDTGDGETETFRVVVAGTGNWSGFVLYTLERA